MKSQTHRRRHKQYVEFKSVQIHRVYNVMYFIYNSLANDIEIHLAW